VLLGAAAVAVAAAAWSGYVRLPKGGLYRILDAVMGAAAARQATFAERLPAPWTAQADGPAPSSGGA